MLLVELVPIPVLMNAMVLTFLASDSTPGSNRFGENPKGVEAAVTPPDANTVVASSFAPDTRTPAEKAQINKQAYAEGQRVRDRQLAKDNQSIS